MKGSQIHAGKQKPLADTPRTCSSSVYARGVGTSGGRVMSHISIKLQAQRNSDYIMCRTLCIILVQTFGCFPQGGAFYFLEHVSANHSSWSFFWQQVYFPTWKLLFDGCWLTRETWADIEKAYFSEVKLQHIRVPLPWTPIQPHIIGYAVK